MQTAVQHITERDFTLQTMVQGHYIIIIIILTSYFQPFFQFLNVRFKWRALPRHKRVILILIPNARSILKFNWSRPDSNSGGEAADKHLAMACRQISAAYRSIPTLYIYVV